MAAATAHPSRSRGGKSKSQPARQRHSTAARYARPFIPRTPMTINSGGIPMRRTLGRVSLTIVVTGVLLSCAYAQPLQTSLQGRVFDPSGAAIIGAAISAIKDGSTEVQ